MGKRKFYGIVAKILIAVLLIPILVMLDGNAISVQAAPKKYFGYFGYSKNANGEYTLTESDSLKVNWYSGSGNPRNYTLSNLVPAVSCYYDYFGEDNDLMVVFWNQEYTGSNVTNPGMNSFDIMNFENVFGITAIESCNYANASFPVGSYSAMEVSQSCNAYNITVEFAPLVQEGLVYSYYKVTRPHEEPTASSNTTASGNNTNPGNTTSGNNTNPGNTTSGNNTNPGNTTSGNNTNPGSTTSGNNTKPGENIRPGAQPEIPTKGSPTIPSSALNKVKKDSSLILYYLLEYNGQKYLLLITGDDVRETPLLGYKSVEWLTENFGIKVKTSTKSGKYYVGTKSDAPEIFEKLGIKINSLGKKPGKNPGPEIGKK